MNKLFSKTKKEWIRMLKNTMLIILGTFALAFGVRLFVFPFKLVTGGISGIGIILNSIPGLDAVGADVYSSIVNWILFVIGFFLLGKEFAAKTLLSTAIYPVALWIAELIMKIPSLSPFINLDKYYTEYGMLPLIIATVFGGACIGAGCALTILGGGSTGGVDVIALTMSKYIKRLKSSVAFFICDTTIIIIGMFAINDLVLSLLGIISAFICAITIDKLFLGESSAFIAHIVSDKYEEINDAVINKMSRTTTIIDAIGGYSKQDKKMVIVTFDIRQYARFTALIATIDKNAFVTVHRAHEINGEGWTYNEHEV